MDPTVNDASITNNEHYHRPTTAIVVPLREDVFIPGENTTVEIGRTKSKLAIRRAQSAGDKIILLTQKNPDIEVPEQADLYPIGVLAKIVTVLPSNAYAGVRIVINVERRIRLVSLERTEPYFEAIFQSYKDNWDALAEEEQEVLTRRLQSLVQEYNQATGRFNKEQMDHILAERPFADRLDYAAALFLQKVAHRYAFLSTDDVKVRAEFLLSHIMQENEYVRIEADLNAKLKVAIDQTQKEYYLREKMKVIAEELGEGQDKNVEIAALRERIEAATMPEKAKEKALRELDRMMRMSVASPEYGIMANYMEFVAHLPWGKYRNDPWTLQEATEVLDADHYGLNDVKERILEFLAVRQLRQDNKGSIVCLVGPPGVGKTSLARSIAHATQRDFVRVALGGVRDEAEIRGHRRTYVGALPGRIMQGINDAGSANPVFLLDEIDKLTTDYHGDPAAALMEVLDPAQNDTFTDHYLDIPFDLSKVLFLTTANTLKSIPGPLRDRLEVIEVPSYTEPEKLEIATRYLIPKQKEAHGLLPYKVHFSEAAVRKIINGYTAEAGVRELERKIESVCRKITKDIVVADEPEKNHRVNVKNIEKYLKKPLVRHLMTHEQDAVGVAVGMAWTAVGGEILQVECQRMQGKGVLTLTGQLGDVMKESATMSFSSIRSRADALEIAPSVFETSDLHLHVAEGAVPKDGPSAGVTITTAMLSALNGKKIKQRVAMTGEMTLRGKVLAVGGIREKVLGAFRAGCDTIVLPADNRQDVDDIPEDVRNQLHFVYAETIEDVWQAAFVEDGGKL